MSKNIIITFVLGMLLISGARASEVYIEQAGSTSTIDITQTGDGNRVGSSSEASTINGTGTDLDITQTGSSNEIDIETGSAAASSDIAIVQDGSSNIADIDLGSVDSTILNIDIDGDSNETTLCGTLTTNAGSATSAVCGSDMSQNDLGVDIDIVGDSNKVAVARSGVAGTSGTTEVTVNIGSGGVASNSNIVNIDQSSTTESGIVDLSIDGSSNAVNITQQ